MAYLDITKSVTIASSGTVSTEYPLVEGHILVGFWTDDTMTGTAITFQGKRADGTFVPIEDGEGSAISKTVSGGEYVPLNPADFSGINAVKLVSGSAEGAERTIYLSLRQVA